MQAPGGYEDLIQEYYPKPNGRPNGTKTTGSLTGNVTNTMTALTPAAPAAALPVAPATAAQSTDGAGSASPATTASGYWSPGLQSLKDKYMGQDYNSNTPGMNTVAGMVDKYSQDITTPVGYSAAERQGIYNQGRNQIQGATKAAMGEMTDAMGGAGFRPGESGMADRRLMGIAQQGQSQLGNLSTSIANQDLQNRFSQGMQLESANQSRSGLANSLAGSVDSANLQRQGLGLQAAGFGAGLEQYQKSQQAAQDAAAASGGMANDRFAFEKDKWGQEFQYQQDMDALQMLQGYYGQAANDQQNAYQPYWQAALNTGA